MEAIKIYSGIINQMAIDGFHRYKMVKAIYTICKQAKYDGVDLVALYEANKGAFGIMDIDPWDLNDL